MLINIPTIITLSRIFLVPFIFIAAYYDKDFLLLCLFLFGSLTDWLDGFLARALNQTTNLGAILDPIADKIFVCSWYILFGFFSKKYILPDWFVYFIITKEILLALGAIFLILKNNKFKIIPSNLAKFLMSLYLVLIFIILQNLFFLKKIFIFLIVILSCLVLIDYALKEKKYV